MKTKLTAAVQEDVIAGILAGKTVRAIMLGLGMHAAYFHHWHKLGRAAAPREPYRSFYVATQAALVACGAQELSVTSRAGRKGVQSFRRRSAHSYKVDESFFSDIHSPEQAYVLGFFATDGWIRGRSTFGWGLCREDRPHLEILRHLLGFDGPIRDRPARPENRTVVAGCEVVIRSGPSSELVVCSRKMVNDLKALGFCPNKTSAVRPWPGPAHLLRHYWRGCVDGDGWVKRLKGRHPTEMVYRIGYCGNRAMVNGFADFLRANGIVFRAAVRPDDSIFRIEFDGSALPAAVARLLYGDATVALDRKRTVAAAAMLGESQTPDRSTLTHEAFERLKSQHGTWVRVAAVLGMSASAVRELARKRRLRAGG